MEKLKMNSYIGSKQIKASEPMTKKDYCDYRGWEVPEDENPDAVVVLVEYQVDKGSAPNHDNHDGYISMSPVHIFDKAYKIEKTIDFVKCQELTERELPPHQERVFNEYNELRVKTDALEFFIIKNQIFKNLNINEQELLNQQLIVMKAYRTLLTERILKF